MTTFKKMKLISEDELDRIKQKQVRDYDPNLRTMAFLQSEIDDIISNKDYDPETKEKLFRVAQHRFLAIKNSGGEPRTESVITSMPTTETTGEIKSDKEQAMHTNEELTKGDSLLNLPTESTSVVTAKEETKAEPEIQAEAAEIPAKRDAQRDLLLEEIPIKHRGKAKKLLNLFNENKDKLSFDTNFSLILNGVPYPDLNFQHLFKNLYVKSDAPAGLDNFLTALKELNVPVSLISNKSLFHSIGTVKTRSNKSFSRKSHSLPPGKRAKIIQVYRM